MTRRVGTRWVVGAFVALAVVVLFLNLGLWQLRRHDQRRAYEALVEPALSGEPVPYEPNLPLFTRVEVTGRYSDMPEVALLGRALDGQPGNHVLTALVFGDGSSAVIVDRGWVPYDPGGRIPPEAAPPDGVVHVVGVLVPTRDDPLVDDESPTAREIDPDAFGRSTGLVGGAAIQLTEQRPGQQTGTGPLAEPPLPRPVPFELDDAPPHLSYAIQWFAFAAVAVIGYALLLRRERGRLWHTDGI